MATTAAEYADISSTCVVLFLHHDGAEAMLREAERCATSRADWEAIRCVYECGFDEKGRLALAKDTPTLPFTIIDGRVVGTWRT
jgi:hypothetical protein